MSFNTAKQIEAIAASTEKLTSGSFEIVKVFEEVYNIASESTSRTSEFATSIDEQLAMIQEVNASTEQLREMADHLDVSIKRFKI